MYPDPYIRYLVHFHADRDYFECHEVLEEYWKSLPEKNAQRFWVGMIQLSVAMYHHRRGNAPGASKMLRSAIALLAAEPMKLKQAGLDDEQLIPQLTEYVETIEQNKPYASIILPISDPALLAACHARCREQGRQFGVPSNLADDYLCNKHSRRDRSEVIMERTARLLEKQQQRQNS